MKSKWKRFNRCDQHANLHYSPPLNGYEQVVEFIMRVARENWKNADELDLVEDLWRSKLFDAGVIPYRKNEKYYRLRQAVSRFSFGVKYDRKCSEWSAFTVYTPLRAFKEKFSALAYLRSLILNRTPALLEARSKGVEYEAEFLQTELIREMQRRNCQVPDFLRQYAKHVQQLVQQQEGKIILDKSEMADDAQAIHDEPPKQSDLAVKDSVQQHNAPDIARKNKMKPTTYIEIPFQPMDIYAREMLPDTPEEAERMLKLSLLYKRLSFSKTFDFNNTDGANQEPVEEEPENFDNILLAQYSSVSAKRTMKLNLHNVFLKLGKLDYFFKACVLQAFYMPEDAKENLSDPGIEH